MGGGGAGGAASGWGWGWGAGAQAFQLTGLSLSCRLAGEGLAVSALLGKCHSWGKSSQAVSSLKGSLESSGQTEQETKALTAKQSQFQSKPPKPGCIDTVFRNLAFMSCSAWAFFSLSPFLASVRGAVFQDGLEVSARQGKRWGERWGERQRERRVF